jgi:hypothetical protein
MSNAVFMAVNKFVRILNAEISYIISYLRRHKMPMHITRQQTASPALATAARAAISAEFEIPRQIKQQNNQQNHQRYVPKKNNLHNLTQFVAGKPDRTTVIRSKVVDDICKISLLQSWN